MKVCYVLDFQINLGGGAQSLLNLVDQIQMYEIEPYIVCEKDCDAIHVARDKNIPTKIIPGKRYVVPHNKLSLLTYCKYPLKRIFNRIHLKQAISYLQNNGIDIVHMNSIFSCVIWAIAARKCKIPYIWHIREFLDKDHDNIIIGKRYMYRLLKGAQKRIAVSKAVKDYWEKILKCKIECVYNGVSAADNYDTCENKFSSDKLNCVLIGRIVEGKGQIEAVNALQEVLNNGFKNIHLMLIGYRGVGAYEKALKKYILEQELQEYVDIINFIPNLKNLRHGQDIGLVCSSAEAFGRVTIEYMMAGLLVIGTDEGGTSELIEHGRTGYLYTKGDIQGLANLLSYVANHHEEAKKIVECGQKNALQNFTIEKTAMQVNKIYDLVLSEGGAERLLTKFLWAGFTYLGIGGVKL